ncbi:class I SAM-dependent methyltransferase [Bosea sp. 124]|uniref:class I SAM-dependent methyltransferase n=1 Tax=Bosea sp. 124 TaxID=2135642 RepID=UPI000D48D70B|nr:class I SAM-dependent methyltransferase [Bosea sp. 124]PTM41755.1 hypothetical protein C8D03_3328 [Bosea sp. 124]
MPFGRLTPIARSILGPSRLGALTYRRYPALGRAWGGPMNGQAGRCKLVADLISRCNFAAVVETGTFRGTTTEWLSAFRVPIYTCEASPENFGFAQARLSGLPDITLLHMDSRAALRHLLFGQLAFEDAPILFYLDAHWNDDLPLADEIEIICDAHHEAVILIDDFSVPDDPGYAYDDYGTGKALTVDYVATAVAKYDLLCRYPSIRSDAETGAKRGCVVISRRNSQVAKHLGSSVYLRHAPFTH